MALKKLSKFEHFDAEGFLEGKRLLVTNVLPYNDYETGAHLGSKVEVVIADDTTEYGEPNISNLFEKLVVKVEKDLNLPLRSEVTVVNPVGKVYGQYRNELSLKSSDVLPVSKMKINSKGEE